MTTPAAGIEGGQGTEGQEAQGGPDFSPVMDRIEQLDAQIGPVVEWIQGQQQNPEGEQPEDDYDDFVSRLFSGEEEQAGAAPEDPQQAPQVPEVFRDPQLFQQLIDRAVERGVEQRVGPLEQERFQRQIEDLLEDLPGLQDEKTQQDTILAAQQIAHEAGAPEAWRSPAFIRMAYLANLAQQRSDEEVPADASGGEARLERGGANPGAEQPGLADQLIQAHRGTSSFFR